MVIWGAATSCSQLENNTNSYVMWIAAGTANTLRAEFRAVMQGRKKLLHHTQTALLSWRGTTGGEPRSSARVEMIGVSIIFHMIHLNVSNRENSRLSIAQEAKTRRNSKHKENVQVSAWIGAR